MLVYIAGSMKETVAREQIKQKLIKRGCTILDPAKLDHCTNENVYTQNDLALIDQSDLVVAFMDSSNPSGYGMNLEVGYAHGKGKRVIFVDMLGNDWRTKYFGMARAVSTVIQHPKQMFEAL